MATNRTEQKTANLRFVERDGKRILQQQVVVSEITDTGGSVFHEWHDIPLVARQEPHEWNASVLTKYTIYETYGGILGRSSLLIGTFDAADDESAIAAVLDHTNINTRYELYAEREPHTAGKDMVAIIDRGAIEWQRTP